MKTQSLIFCLVAVVAYSGIIIAAPGKPNCGSNPADIVFILDESGSIYGPHFELQKDFVSNFVQRHDENVRFGIITFGTQVRHHLKVQDSGRKDVIATVEGIRQMRGQTYTNLAIKEMLDNSIFRGEGIPKICILITDGNSDFKDKTAEQADLAKQEGIKFIAVGILDEQMYGAQKRKELERELHRIASDPSGHNVFMLDNYGELMNIMDTILSKVCPTTTTTTTTPAPTLPQMIQGCNARGAMDVVISVPGHLDTFDNENAHNFILGLIRKLTNPDKLGAEYTQFGITSSQCDKSRDGINLDEYDTYNGFRAAFERRTSKWIGTKAATEFKAMNSMLGRGRQSAHKVEILIVDGEITDPRETSEESTLAGFDKGVLVIGVGADETELRESIDGSNYVLTVPDYSQLTPQFIEAVVDSMCDALEELMGN